MCKLVPDGMKLTFDGVPASIESSAPEPSTPGFRTLAMWLQDQVRYVSEELAPIGDHDMDQRRLALLRRLTSEIDRLQQIKETAWAGHIAAHIMKSHMSETDQNGPLCVKREGSRGVAYAASLQPYVLAGLLMATVLHSLAATARMPVQYVLRVLQVVLYGAFLYCNSTSGSKTTSLTPDQKSILETVPIDIKTIINDLELSPDFIRFACCPTCRFTYPPDPKKPHDPYPRTCIHQETDKPVCGTPLVYAQSHGPKRKKGTPAITYEPFMIFPFRSPTAWLVDLISRPGMRTLLRQSWDPKDSPPGVVPDILDSEAIRSFLGPDKKTPFCSQPDDTLNLVFTLFVDWFNPFGNKKAGKSHSVGVIYLALQNLPAHLRYRAENMCLVGVIPGPHEPELHQLNHFLRPLVDELLRLWHHGVYLDDCSQERALLFIRAALIALVCDVPALRKAGGFAGHMATHFCSFCELPKADINNLAREKWPRHNCEQHRRYATQWRDAKTEAAREAEFKAHGIRWSELLRLEYWDPTKFAVVDAMHNLFLGELRHHCRDVWGLDIKDKGGDGQQLDPHNPDQQRAQLERVRAAVLGGHRNALDKIRKGYIVAVARLNNVAPMDGNPAKKAYVDALLNWGKSSSTVNLPPVLSEPTTDFLAPDHAGDCDIPRSRIIDRETIEHIRRDIGATYFPSWVERPPRNFGSPSHGKLKADQWRMVYHMPLTFMKYFYIGANLRWFLTGFEWPGTDAFRSMVNAFREAFASLSSGARMGGYVPFGAPSCQPTLEDYDEKKEERLPPPVYSQLVTLLSSPMTHFSSGHGSLPDHPILNDSANYVSRVEHRGVSFATRRSGLRDSFIVFDNASPDQRFPRAGQITDIFLHVRIEREQSIAEYFLIVDEYTSLNDLDKAKDPYRRFTDLQTRLFYRRSQPSPRVIRLENIQGHFAAFFYKPDDIAEECVVVRSLDRVCSFTSATPAMY
ncbi:hypothetical protein GSI_12594 [Ganoderma sinense ZZ0214-1]|uniref:Transposase family Tnp2 protein n=1 Tax=Ganoderma sinense ZZ0214-1 TaxID=1077348 RepID=A0A2G8RTP3_9APHY|nr:hypothetical protein GSI_12594 [Ganoderma sinense ZZ0214-1]